MPSVVAFEPPKPASPGSSSDSSAIRRLSRSSPAGGNSSASSASAFRQQLNQVERNNGRDRADASRGDSSRADASRTEQQGESSRASRSEPGSKAAKAAARKGRKAAAADDARDAEETDEADDTQSGDPATTVAETQGLAATIDDLPTDTGTTPGGTEDDANAPQDNANQAALLQSRDALALAQGAIQNATPTQTPAEASAVADAATAATNGGDVAANGAMAVTARSGAASDAAAAAQVATSGTAASGAGDELASPADAATTATAGGEKKSIGVSAIGARPAANRPSGPDADADADIANGSAASTSSASSTGGAAANPTLSMMAQFAEAFAPDTATADLGKSAKPAADASAAPAGPASPSADAATLTQQGKSATSSGTIDAPADVAEPERSTEARFAATNHVKIASEVRGALMPNGGKMELRLDPPELGALQVSMHIKDGVVTATFQTQNPEAARLLSHSLADLRQSLEAQGVTVDKLHVQQAPKDESSSNNPNSGDRQNVAQEQQRESRREQQRKDMVQRLWDQLSGNAPIDVRA